QLQILGCIKGQVVNLPRPGTERAAQAGFADAPREPAGRRAWRSSPQLAEAAARRMEEVRGDLEELDEQPGWLSKVVVRTR
ncbi:MAG TPA: hypothetical protein VFA92_09025, partial [Candidatus Binatia bacterium]|nr:hypothetical protein [Candidatus Binatia bacterium]